MNEQLLVRLTKLFSGAVLFCQPHQQLLSHSLDKALVFFIFFVCRRVGEYVSLELFCFVLQEQQIQCKSFRKVKLSLLELKGHV